MTAITIIKNLTPHPINIDGVEFPPAGPAVRCSEVIQPGPSFQAGGQVVKTIRKKLGDLIDMPAPAEGVVLVVSLAAATKAWEMGRTDVVAIGETIRDEKGRITGCVSLSTHPDDGLKV